MFVWIQPGASACVYKRMYVTYAICVSILERSVSVLAYVSVLSACALCGYMLEFCLEFM